MAGHSKWAKHVLTKRLRNAEREDEASAKH